MHNDSSTPSSAPAHIVKGAAEILAHIEASSVPEHEYVSVREEDFGHLDLNFYRKARAALEAAGFVFLEDCEDLTLAKAPGQVFCRVMIRVLVSGEGTTMAGLYHPKIRTWWMRLLMWILRQKLKPVADLETEFSDGTFVCTSNGMAASAMESPALISVDYLPAGTAVEAVLARHRERVTARLARADGVFARRATSISEVRASQNRMNGIKAAYRGEIGGVTREELERLSKGNTELAAQVHAEVQRQRAERHGG